MKIRNFELDFVKGIMITLMVLCHMIPFRDANPLFSKWVYAFHMPSFLIISGYFFNYKKSSKDFLKSLRLIIVPYVVFESINIIAKGLIGSKLGVLDVVDFSFLGLLKHIAIVPDGTIWYLHTLSIYMIVVYLVYRLVNTIQYNTIQICILSGIILYLLSLCKMGFEWMNIVYLLFGTLLRDFKINLNDKKYSSLFSVIPIVAITMFASVYSKTELSGFGLTLFMISFLIASYSYLPRIIQRTFTLLGVNSLSIVLFSHMTVIFTRLYASLFSFDSSYTIYAIVSTILILVICLIAAYVFDKLKLSQLIVGKNLYTKL